MNDLYHMYETQWMTSSSPKKIKTDILKGITEAKKDT